jgi:hypothetical protein
MGRIQAHSRIENKVFIGFVLRFLQSQLKRLTETPRRCLPDFSAFLVHQKTVARKMADQKG